MAEASIAGVDGEALARRSFVLVRNERAALPIDPAAVRKIALSGVRARDARVLGGGSAQVFPHHIVSPLDGLTAALPEDALDHRVGADPNSELAPAEKGFELRAVCYDTAGTVLGSAPLHSGSVRWTGDDLPDGVTHETPHSVEITGPFVPRDTGEHAFGTRGTGALTLTVAGETLYDGIHRVTGSTDPGEAFFGSPLERGRTTLTAGVPVKVSLRQVDRTGAACVRTPGRDGVRLDRRARQPRGAGGTLARRRTPDGDHGDQGVTPPRTEEPRSGT
ncbi:glycoside hydrolase family 3 C-terminal domain-containing protein [Streptomyces sp. NBC_01318]|uniref:glycoside hydrolase family 3 C-terminal domain-containing protein n=1 Tax=Streptomyces sp. NBC_01318 TaxID=2903823 RepID=UPI003FA3C705